MGGLFETLGDATKPAPSTSYKITGKQPTGAKETLQGYLITHTVDNITVKFTELPTYTYPSELYPTIKHGGIQYQFTSATKTGKGKYSATYTRVHL